MAEEQAIVYAPQWNNMTVDNVLSENYSFTEQVNSIQQLLAYCLITRTEVNIGEIIYSDLITKLLNKSRLKYVSYPRFISCALQVLLRCDYTQEARFGYLPAILSNSNFTKDPSKVTDIELTAHMIAVNNQRDSVSPLPLSAKPKKGKSHTVTPTLPKSHGPKASRALSKKSKKPKSKKTPAETKATSTPKPTEGFEQSYSVSLGTGTRKSRPLPKSTTIDPKDSVGNKQPIDTGFPSTTSDEGTAKTTPRPEGSLGDKDSGGNKPPADIEPINPTVVDPSSTRELDTPPLVLSTYADVRAFLLSDDEAQESEDDILGAGEEMDEDPQAASIAETHHRSHPPQADKPQSSHAPSTEALDTDSSCDDILKKYNNTLPLTECQLATVNYTNLKASVDEYYDENIAHRDQTDKLVEASMSSLDKSSTTIHDLYKGLNVIIELLKEIKNKKISEATESFTKISTNITEVLSLVKGFNFSDLQSSVNALQAHALKQDEELAAWAKSSTNMAWNLGSRLSGQSLGSVTPKLAPTHILANVEGENDTNSATKDPLSHSEGKIDTNRQEKSEEPKHSTDTNIKEGKGIATDKQVKDKRKLVKASSIIRPDPDALIPYTINGEVYYLTVEQLQAHMDKEEQIKKAEEEAGLFAISNPEVIKVVREEAKKFGFLPKEAITTKAGEKIKKAQDVEHEVLKRQHT
ncbi:hypothetical protein Tco_0862234, partial [Tanacetum coccineum]